MDSVPKESCLDEKDSDANKVVWRTLDEDLRSNTLTTHLIPRRGSFGSHRAAPPVNGPVKQTP